MKSKLFSLLFALLAYTNTLFADATKIGSLYYLLDDNNNTAQVTHCTSYYKSGAGYTFPNISIPDSVNHGGKGYKVVSIGAHAFYKCSDIISVSIPHSVSYINQEAFYSCTNLTSITIPENVILISSDAFNYCSNLTLVVINSNTIASDEYTTTTNLGKIFGPQVNTYMIGDSIKSIGDYAFSQCQNLTSILLPENLTRLGEYAFNECASLPVIDIPSNVTHIGKYAFSQCNVLDSIVLPQGITKIEDGTFSGCRNLSRIVLHDNIDSIGQYAFSGCSNLSSLVLPINIKEIGAYAFNNCTKFISFIIPIGIKHIEDGVFNNCKQLRSINLHNGISTIGERAFYSCKFSSIALPDSLKSIGNYSFANCDSLITIDIPTGVKSIGNYAFSNCSNLDSITIPNSINDMGGYTFKWCINLKSLSIPEGVTYIGDGLCAMCNSLTSVTLPTSITRIWQEAFLECRSLTHIEIPNNVSSIEYAAFKNCSGLTTISFGENVSRIEASAFSNCSSLTSIVLPSSITDIGSTAFSGCSSISSVWCFAINPPTLNNSFYGVDCASIPLFVPKPSIPAYQSTNGWKDFYPIVGITEKYTIKFINWDGEELLKLTDVEEGTIPVYTGITPTRPEDEFFTYTFNGWMPTIVAAYSDETYTATYISNRKEIYYNVSFIDWNGQILKSEQVLKGEPAIAPSNPTREGYVFIGWDKDFSNVQNDMEVYAIYELVEGVDNIKNNAISRKELHESHLYIYTPNGEVFDGTGVKLK